MITFLTAYLLMLLIGSIVTLGFYTITRGEIKTLPNGNLIEEKEIFGNWQLFWEEVIRYNKVFYYGDQLEIKLKILEQLKPGYINEISFSTGARKSLFFKDMPSDAEIRDIEWTLNCHVFKNDTVLFLYDNMPEYRFPEWVRKITNCYVCLSSVGGSIWYFSLIHFYPDIFNLSVNPELAKYVYWVFYCISLSFFNKAVKENLIK